MSGGRKIGPFSLLSFTKKPPSTIPFQDFHTNWLKTLQKTLLPLLRQSLLSATSSPSPSSLTLLSSRVHLLLHHLFSFYDALDAAANSSAAALPHLLFPSFKSPLQTPFLFLGDLHPCIFTNLLRSFLEDENKEEEDEEKSNQIFDLGLTWKDPSQHLMIKIEHVERGLRLMVPALVERKKKAEEGFVKSVAEEWIVSEGTKMMKERKILGVGEAMEVEMEELVNVFVDANRLRRTVISDIVGALNVYQGALFLEGLSQFLVGFQDQDLLKKFKKYKST